MVSKRRFVVSICVLLFCTLVLPAIITRNILDIAYCILLAVVFLRIKKM